MNDDFGYSSQIDTIDSTVNNDSNSSEAITDLNDSNSQQGTSNVPNSDNNDSSIKDVSQNDSSNDSNNDSSSDSNSNVSLEAGMTVEVGDDKYTVDANGNLVDTNGNIFKEASEVQAWMDSFDKVDDTTSDDIISIDSIREAIGVDITDDDDNVISFDNTPNGIKEYINSVIESSKDEYYDAAINTLMQKYPILQDVINYYVANGNSMDGYGQMPDRSGITVDDSNEAQQEAIIRTAWAEQGRKGDINGYIQYLKSAGTLYASAVDELKALQESDAELKNKMAAEAEQREAAQMEQERNYWQTVYNTIQARRLGNYEIPQSIIIKRNGTSLSVTPEDFFNYVYRVDKDGKSAYVNDLMNESPENRLQDELLRAYLRFTGGSYSNLVDMAINNQKVNTLRLKAKERKQSTVRVSKPNNKSRNISDIDLGYN